MAHQLDEVVTQLNHQQTTITNIQGTLAYHQTIIDAQQNDIVDIRVSINNIIHSLSDITAKLGFQITLPPLLPLSPPTLPPIAAASAPTPSHQLQLQTLSATPQTIIAPPAPCQVNTIPNDDPKTTSRPSNPDSLELPELELLYVQEISYHALIGATDLMAMWPSTSILGQPTATLMYSDGSTIFLITVGHGENTHRKEFCGEDYICFLRGLVVCEIMMDESKVFIFDPGGNFDIKQLGSGGGVVTKHVQNDRLQKFMILLQKSQVPGLVWRNTKGSSQGAKVVLFAFCRLHISICYLARGLNTCRSIRVEWEQLVWVLWANSQNVAFSSYVWQCGIPIWWVAELKNFLVEAEFYVSSPHPFKWSSKEVQMSSNRYKIHDKIIIVATLLVENLKECVKHIWNDFSLAWIHLVSYSGHNNAKEGEQHTLERLWILKHMKAPQQQVLILLQGNTPQKATSQNLRRLIFNLLIFDHENKVGFRGDGNDAVRLQAQQLIALFCALVFCAQY